MAKKNTAPKADGPVVMGAPITDHEAAILSALEGEHDNTLQNSEAPASVQSEKGQPTGDTEQTLPQIADTYTDEVKLEMAKKIAKGFEDRSTYEKTKNPNNERIHKALDKTRAKLTMPSAAAILIAAQVEPDFINRSVAEGSRYNVYAADKLADLVKGLRDGALTNKINIAICKSLFAFRAAGEKFTGEMAKAAACDKMKVTAAMQKILIRHTVDPGTMSTQTSSTMTALQTMGIVKNTGSFRAPVYELTDTPQTKRLKEVLAA